MIKHSFTHSSRLNIQPQIVSLKMQKLHFFQTLACFHVGFVSGWCHPPQPPNPSGSCVLSAEYFYKEEINYNQMATFDQTCHPFTVARNITAAENSPFFLDLAGNARLRIVNAKNPDNNDLGELSFKSKLSRLASRQNVDVFQTVQIPTKAPTSSC